jgi:hypothetical protein
MEIINQAMRVEIENLAKKMNMMAKKIEQIDQRIDKLVDMQLVNSKNVFDTLNKEQL